jgi:membrane-bound metal-dependent hydrolase YbcI (DUF457 family)
MSSFGPHLMAGTVIGLVGTTASAVISPELDSTCGLVFVAGVAGALTPDMDIKSKSSMFMYSLYVITSSILFITGNPNAAFLLLLYSLIPQFFGHRGFIHSTLFGIISSILLFIICLYNNLDLAISGGIVGSYFFGFLSHLLLDEVK